MGRSVGAMLLGQDLDNGFHSKACTKGCWWHPRHGCGVVYCQGCGSAWPLHRKMPIARYAEEETTVYRCRKLGDRVPGIVHVAIPFFGIFPQRGGVEIA